MPDIKNFNSMGNYTPDGPDKASPENAAIVSGLPSGKELEKARDYPMLSPEAFAKKYMTKNTKLK